MARRLRENSISVFNGLRQSQNPLAVKSGDSISLFASLLNNLRPQGGMLEKIPGNSLHSILKYKAGSRVMTLIRYTMDTGTKFFICTTWDNILSYSGSAWNALLSSSSLSGVIPSGLPFDEGYGIAAGKQGNHRTALNTVWD